MALQNPRVDTLHEHITPHLTPVVIAQTLDWDNASSISIKSAAIGSDNKLSRQTVKNHIKKLKPLEKKVESEEQKRIKELHIYADEDHAHMQRPGKKKGKRSKIVPLVTVTEGIRKEIKGRNRTISSMHFVENEENETLIQTGYGKAYKCSRLG